MKNLPSVIFAILIFGATEHSVGQQEHSDADTVRNTRGQYNDAIARHDSQAISDFLDSEYQVTTSLGQLVQDRGAEESVWATLFASRKNLLYVRSPEQIDVSRDYPLAAERGTWVGTWTTDKGPVRTGGHYSAMWRKINGAWKVRSELFVALYCDGELCP